MIPRSASLRRVPLQLRGYLKKFKSFHVTPVIGTEFPDASLVDWINASNSDDLLRDLAITISRRGVLFFRAQNMTDSLQKQLTQRLGVLTGKPDSSGLHIHPLTNFKKDQDQNINIITTDQAKNPAEDLALLEARRPHGVRGNWHTDISYEPNPSDYTILKLTDMPETGGDTMFASSYELYDRISLAYRKFLEGLTVICTQSTYPGIAAEKGFEIYCTPRGSPSNVGTGLTAVHPMVRTNPVTGWKSLYGIGHHFIRTNEFTVPESARVHDWLLQMVVENDDCQLRHRWHNRNDIAIWDNRSVLHRAILDFEGIRTGRRTVGETLELGEEGGRLLNPDADEGSSPSNNKFAISVAYLGAILATSDESIVVATYETIAAQFQGEIRGIWLVVAFNLGYCISLPMYGTMSDIHGCKQVLLCAYLIFDIWFGGLRVVREDALSGGMASLVTGRFTTGIGAGGLHVLISILIKDIVPPKDVALMRSYTNVVNTTGRGIGAPLGSLIRGTVGWRWSFAGRLPVIIGCSLLVKLFTPESQLPQNDDQKSRLVDYPGICTFSVTMVALILGMNLETNLLLQTGFIVGGIISATLFIWVELFVADTPLVPLNLIRVVGSFWLVQILAFSARDAIRSVIVPYLTRVQDMADAPASIFIGLMSLGFSAGAVLSGLYIKRFKKYYAMSLKSHIINIGMSLLLYGFWARESTTWGCLVIFPISMATGIISSTQFIGMTTSVSENESTSVIGVYYICQQLGAIMGSSSAASILKNRLTHSVAQNMADDSNADHIVAHVLRDPKYIWSLPSSTQTVVHLSLQYGYKFVPYYAVFTDPDKIKVYTGCESDSIFLHPIQTSLICVALVLCYCVTRSVLRAFKPGLRLIPGPIIARFSSFYRPWLISGGEAPDVYRKLHEQYGKIVRTGPNSVDISDPDAIAIIYGISSKFLKSGFYDAFSPIYENEHMPSMFSIRDPCQHQALRRPVAQKFSMSSIKSMEPLADECTKIFVNAMKSLAEERVDLGVWLQWYAFDVIGAITFQHRFGFMEERKDIRGMIGALDMGLQYAALAGQVPWIHSLLMGNRWFGGFLAAQPFIDVPDPLRTIVQYTQECIDELAGSDTTGISLRAIIYFIVKNPTVYQKLQQEIDTADEEGRLSEYVTYAECLQLEYLQVVMKEAMRCCPGVSFPLERIVPQGGTTLCGIHLTAGTVVGVNPAVIHHDQSIFGEDASQFRPERWTDADPATVKIMDKHLMTFGYGSRTCIGKNISIMEMGKLIPQILRHFDIEWASDKPEWHVKTFWFAKQHDLVCRLSIRDKGSH
ncbi:hypothetical protein FE257_003585 [Aspergillus nanangensis]|uniref:Major facilitator superfamily (MFS) profile domain-containing protein n=1 Tax=Aspergillus nanangensis TaxID=2582783 RepID=A0AAD4CRV8_ASPNN|nr:hypothetical protein FE257_003585 [Aspergillus nanangensis]